MGNFEDFGAKGIQWVKNLLHYETFILLKQEDIKW